MMAILKVTLLPGHTDSLVSLLLYVNAMFSFTRAMS